MSSDSFVPARPHQTPHTHSATLITAPRSVLMASCTNSGSSACDFINFTFRCTTAKNRIPCHIIRVGGWMASLYGLLPRLRSTYEEVQSVEHVQRPGTCILFILFISHLCSSLLLSHFIYGSVRFDQSIQLRGLVPSTRAQPWNILIEWSESGGGVAAPGGSEIVAIELAADGYAIRRSRHCNSAASSIQSTRA